MRFPILTFLLALALTGAAQESWWTGTLATGEYGTLRINVVLRPDGSLLSGTTTPDAHKRIIGGLKASFAKSMFARDGSMVALDSLQLRDGRIDGFLWLDKRRYLLGGSASDTLIEARLTGKTTGKTYGSLTLRRTPQPAKPRDYTALWRQIRTLTEQKIYNRSVLQQRAWERFCKDMDAFATEAADDAEFAYGFYYRARSLPFTHYVIEGNKAATSAFAIPGYNAAEAEIRPRLSRLSDQTLLLEVPAFNFRMAEIDSLMRVVAASKAARLVIDLRKNTGGDMEGGLRISQYLIGQRLYGGVMLSQRYWDAHQAPPATSEYTRFRNMSNESYAWFRKQVREGVEGLCLVSDPVAERFTGKVYLLTSNNTASAAEPFVYALQQAGIATVVGEKTAGAVISMEYFPLDGLSVTIPMLDYYTADGKRLDKVGVRPDVECPREEALDRVIALIGSN